MQTSLGKVGLTKYSQETEKGTDLALGKDLWSKHVLTVLNI